MLQPELIVYNGNLITLDRRRPRASAMAIGGERILDVGNDEQILRLATGDTQRLDLNGQTVTPGFIDSHIHLYAYGEHLLRNADLVGCRDIDEILSRLSELARRSEGWIQGHGFDQDKLAERRFPTRQDLDRVSRHRPIIISRICGHAVVVNSAALAVVTPAERLAGDEDGGLYTENAVAAFYRRIPPLSESQAEQAVLAAARVALKTGITSVQTLLDTPEQMAAYARLRRKGKLPIRVIGMPPYAAVEQLHRHGINSGFGDDWLRFGACKLFSDGSLGARTALLAEPYHDQPDTRGLRIYPPDELKRMARDAQLKGFGLAIHAIGDQAVRETIDAIEFALAGDSNEQHRHRIEHASVCPPDCIQRMAAMKIVVTCQPQFVTSDTWTSQRLGPARSPWAYPFATMRASGVPIALSSDCPVEKLDAFACLHSAIARHEWSPGETLLPEQAIAAYCLGSAYAAHVEDRVGSLEPGKLADFVVLSGDPTRLPAEQIPSLRAVRVFVAGRAVPQPP
ncbi:amidohydrolase [Fontivita pretiosa]|uniref:amidohydrolase n=1 Tax=Fontivita pretiosa TaxID=2989684 RepID=UPI003D171584